MDEQQVPDGVPQPEVATSAPGPETDPSTPDGGSSEEVAPDEVATDEVVEGVTETETTVEEASPPNEA